MAKYKTKLFLLLLTAGALLVHGYHPYAEDAEIYLPGVEKILHPELFPGAQEFFTSHASLTFFPNLVAFSLRASHLPMEVGLFLWHLASIFLLLLACWELSTLFFPASQRGRRCGVCLVAALLTIPVAGTALYIMDQYLNPRNLAAVAAIFMLARTLEKKYMLAFLWLLFAAAIHPLMWVFPCSFCILLLVMDKFGVHWKKRTAMFAGSPLLAGMPLVSLPSQPYEQVAKLHGYFYIQNWAWYEWLGIAAPLGLFWWFGRMAQRRQLSNLERVSRAFVIYGLIFLAVSLVVDLPARFELLARLQPLRNLHLLYMVLFLVMGGFAGEYVLRDRVWRWLALFVPLCTGMFLAQRALFPQSAHLEWPGTAPKNSWAQAFVWIRRNTPVNALFALDPQYMEIPGEDENGFRCRAQRSRLADGVKDNGVVSMFPPLAEEWWAQVQAQTPWKNFQVEDFSRLKSKYGVNWLMVQQPGPSGLNCVYENSAVRVCKIP